MKALFPVTKAKGPPTEKLIGRYSGHLVQSGVSTSDVYELEFDEPGEIAALKTVLGLPLEPKFQLGATVVVFGKRVRVAAVALVEIDGVWGFKYETAEKETFFEFQAKIL